MMEKQIMARFFTPKKVMFYTLAVVLIIVAGFYGRYHNSGGIPSQIQATGDTGGNTASQTSSYPVGTPVDTISSDSSTNQAAPQNTAQTPTSDALQSTAAAVPETAGSSSSPNNNNDSGPAGGIMHCYAIGIQYAGSDQGAVDKCR